MSAFTGGFPVPPAPSTAPVLAWDGRQFSPTTALSLASLVLSGALAAASITNASLTSGRVPYATTAGLMTDSAALTFNGSTQVTIGDGTATYTLAINGAAAQSRQIVSQTAGVGRWTLILANATAESVGSDNGSDFQLQAKTDAGANIDSPIIVTRKAGGAIAFSRPLQPVSGSAGAPSYAFSTDTTTGFFRASSGAVGYASAGSEKARFTSSAMLLNANAGVSLGTAPITAFAGYNLYGADSAGAYYGVMTFGASPGIFCKRAEGTSASPTQSTTSSVLFEILQAGYEGTTPGFTSARVAYRQFGTESYTSTAQGYDHRWFTTATGGTTNSEKMRLGASGNLLIGTSTDGMTAAGSLAVTQDFRARQTTDSTSVTTGCGVFSGGVAVTKNIVCGQGVASGVATTATAAGTTTLTNSSAQVQIFTGSTTQTVQLPAANLFGAGVSVTYTLINRSTGSVSWQRAGSDTINGATSTVAVTTNTVGAIYSDGVSAWYTK